MENTNQQIVFIEVENEVEERVNDIKKLNEDIVKIHQIFNELSVIVKHQGEQIEQTSNQTERSREHAQNGLNEINQSVRRVRFCVIQ